MIKVLSDLEKKVGGPSHVIVRFDEMKERFQKDQIISSILISVFCTLYEEHSCKTGLLRPRRPRNL